MTPEERAGWERNGFLEPRQALTEGEARRLLVPLRARVALTRLVDARRRWFDKSYPWLQNRHGEWPELGHLVRLAPIWSIVSELLPSASGLQVWRTNLFFGTPRTPWHRDRYDRLLDDGAKTLSVLVALSGGSRDNCTLVLPGSHAWTDEQLADAKLSAGLSTDEHPWGNERYAGAADDAKIRRINLAPGEFLVFHPMMVHASAATFAPKRRLPRPGPPRVALALRVTTGDVRVRPEAFTDVLPRLSGPVLVPSDDAGRARFLV
jgi:phytanoyl-CoA dioxygenase PhyH